MFVWKGFVRALAAFAAFAALNGSVMAAYDFEKAWKEVADAQMKGLPRSVTNLVEEIAREAATAKRWPDAARAFLVRESAMGAFTDELTQDWLPAFAASVDAQPAPLQAVLQLHLAHTYVENSKRWRWGGAAPTKLDDEAAKNKMPLWSPEKIASTLEAQFAKVFALADELKAQKLSEWSALFNPGNFPKSYCPTLFDFAVRDAVQFYGETIPDETLKKGLALYDRLVDFHRQDGNLDALALAELKRAEYIWSFDQKPEKERQDALESFLDDFLVRYGDKTDVTALAAAKKADSLREGDEFVAARALAAKYVSKWPKSPGGILCANVIAQIEKAKLSVETERTWCTPWPEIKARVRNLSEIHFRLVPVTFDDLVTDKSMGTAERVTYADFIIRDKYLTRKAAKEWKESLALKPDYTEQEFTLPVPHDLKPGHYVLYASANDRFGSDKLPLFAQYVTVTSLTLVLETGFGAFEGTVYRAESGVPVSKARVELWGYDLKTGRKMMCRETYKTDENGHFIADAMKDRHGAISRYVRVVKDGEEVLSLNNAGSGRKEEEEQKYEHVDLFTDRSLYRPGQEICVKGIAYHANPNTKDFHTWQNQLILVTLTDPNRKEVAAKRIRTNRWGSFTYTFTAPTDRLTGEYEVMARVVLEGGVTGESKKRVNVEEYKRPKFKAELEKASDKATLGKPVTVTGKALTYSGLPVQKAKVTWDIHRRTCYPSWWSWFGGRNDDGDGFIDSGETETDENGVFRVTFTPVASPKADLSGDPSFQFEVGVTVTDATGEAHSAEESFEIGIVAWRASVWTDGDWSVAEKPIPVRVSLKSLAGTPVPVKGTLKAFRLKAPESPVRKPENHRNWSVNEKGAWNWTTWEPGEEALSLNINGDKAEKWEGELKLDAGAYRLVFETTDPNGKSVKDIHPVIVLAPNVKGLGIHIPEFFRVESHTVKVGETLRSYWGTGYASGYCRVKVMHNGKALLDTSVSGENPVWFYELPVTPQLRGEIRIETVFVRENRIYKSDATVNVPWDNKYLDITATHLTSKLLPGKKETWTFKVSGPAEVLAFLFDKSLDAYKWHDVSLGFSSYFTPWTRYYRSKVLQNSVCDLARIEGFFPDNTRSFSLNPPSWKVLERRLYKVANAPGRLFNRAAPIAACAAVEESAPALDVAVEEPAVTESMTDRTPGRTNPDPQTVQPRRNLKETAFFFPNLETDAEGNVSFTFTVPDALTGWKFLMVAHDNAINGCIFRNEEIVTTKPLMCEPNAPRFVREGDDFLFAAKVTNTEDKPQKGEVSLSLEEMGHEANKSSPSHVSCLTPPQTFTLAPHESKTFEFRVKIADGCGYLKYVATAKGESFADGEEGILPVLARRILVREAVQLHARGKETRQFKLENLLASKGSATIRHQDLTVRAVSRPAWYAVLSLPYLMEFPHECCEQTFSRFYANALGEYIANADPRIRQTFDAWKAAGGDTLKSPLETDSHLKSIALEATPWVREAEHESAARARLGALLGEDRLSVEQKSCLEKLRLSRNSDGLWPWFPGGPSSDSISLYILIGFARLNALTGTAYPDFFERAVRSLDSSVSENVKERLKPKNLPFRVNGFDIRWMYLHSFKSVPEAKDKKLVPLFVQHLREEWTDFNLSSHALASIALKRMGEEKLAKEILASIKERGVLSDELGMYWKLPYFFSCSVFAAPVSMQAVIIEAFREVTGDETSAEACCVWLLKQKQTQDWTTTAATADAIYALLLGGGTDLLAGDTLAEVTLGGAKVTPEKVEAGTGMYSVRYTADAIRPEMGGITFTGAGEKGVSWGGVHWSYFEDVLKVRAHEPKELRVEKKYYKKVKGAEGTRLTKIEGTLEPGDEIVARLEITSDRTYEFVHLSDERPASAEPMDVLSSYRWQDGVGYYQSTKDTATHYYIDRLNKGVFVLETSYRVQQRGVFTGGLATIQCMYAPEFTAHSTAETIHVDTNGK